MRKQFAVLGLGRFGTYLAISLAQHGYSVLAVDKDEKRVQEVADQITSARVLDCSDIEALREAGVANCDVAVVAIGSDLEASVLATMALKELDIPVIVSKALNEMHGKILEKIGATKVVYPERDVALRLARVLTSANVLDIIQISPDYTLLEEEATPYMVGKTLAQLELDKKSGIVVLAIKRNEHLVVGPASSEVIKEGDLLVIVGETQEVDEFLRRA